MRRFAPFTMPDPGVHDAPIQLSTLADMRTDKTEHARIHPRAVTRAVQSTATFASADGLL